MVFLCRNGNVIFISEQQQQLIENILDEGLLVINITTDCDEANMVYIDRSII